MPGLIIGLQVTPKKKKEKNTNTKKSNQTLWSTKIKLSDGDPKKKKTQQLAKLVTKHALYLHATG